MPKYNHAFTVAFEVVSEDPEGATVAQIRAGLKRFLSFPDDDIMENANAPFDTYEVPDDYTPPGVIKNPPRY